MIGLALSLTLLAPARAPCPDLSGHFVVQGEDGRVQVRVVQWRCDSVAISYEIHSAGDSSNTHHRFRVDNRPRLDPGWFGDPRRRKTTAAFRADTLVLAAPADSAELPEWTEARLYLLPSRELCLRFTGPIPAFGGDSRAGRVLIEGQAGENDAADRSDGYGC